MTSSFQLSIINYQLSNNNEHIFINIPLLKIVNCALKIAADRKEAVRC